MKISCDNIHDYAGSIPLVQACDVVGHDNLRMTTPFSYPDGSKVDLFLANRTPLHDGWVLTDLGHTSAFLFDLGMRLTTQRRRQVVEDACGALGVERNDGELVIEIDERSLSEELQPAIVRLGQACVRVADIIFTKRFQATSVFKDDVEEFIAAGDVEVESNVILEGQFREEVIDFRTRGDKIRSLIQTLASATGHATHPISNETFRKWHDLAPLLSEYQFLTIYDSQASKFRDDDLARLEQTSTLLAFPEQQEQIMQAIAA